MIEFHTFRPTATEAFTRIENFCPENAYKALADLGVLNGFVPSDLLAKTSDCTLVRTGTPDGDFGVGIFNRRDPKAGMKDQNIFVWATGNHDLVFSDHANWSARSIPLSSSALAYCPNMPSASSGYTKDLGEHFLDIVGVAIIGYLNRPG